MEGKVANTTQCYIRRGGKTLLLHRKHKDRDTLGGKWVAVGGNFEPGETPEECVRREVWEETGLTLRDVIFRGLITFVVFKKETKIDLCYAFIFESDSFDGKVIESDEGDLEGVSDGDIFQKEILDKDRIFLPWIYKNQKSFCAKFEMEEEKMISHDVKFY